MMPDFNRLINPIRHSMPDLFRHGSRIAGELAGRLATHIQHLPGQMHQDHRVAVAVFVVSNVAFFALAQTLVNYLNHRIEKHPEELSKDEKMGKEAFLSGVLGLSVGILNHRLARITHTPLNLTFIALISMTAIAVRTLLNRKPTEQKPDMESVVAQDPKEVVPGTPPKEALEEKKEEIIQENPLKNAIEKLHEQHQTMINDLNTQIDSLKAKGIEQEKALQEALDQAIALKSTSAEFEAKFKAAVEEKDTLVESLAEAKSQLHVAQGEVPALQEKIKELTTEVAKLKEFTEKKLRALADENQQLKNEKAAQASTIEELSKPKTIRNKKGGR